MFSMHDRIRSALLGLGNVHMHSLGNEEGFFYQLPNQPSVLFVTLTDTEAFFGEIRYRFSPHNLSTAQPKGWQQVRGWPGWVQVINPCCEDEEAVWMGILASYRHASQSVQVVKETVTVAKPSRKPRIAEGAQHAVL